MSIKGIVKNILEAAGLIVLFVVWSCIFNFDFSLGSWGSKLWIAMYFVAGLVSCGLWITNDGILKAEIRRFYE